MKNILFLFLSFVFYTSNSFAQEENPMVDLEQELIAHFEELKQNIADSLKLKANEKTIQLFEKALKNPSAFKYDFPELKIAKLISDDEKLKVYTWNIWLQDGSNQYFGFLHYKKKKKKYLVIKLKDVAGKIKKAETTVLKNGDFYGAIYYDIISTKRGKKTYYNLIGWNSKDLLTNEKIIDVLYFAGNRAMFGSPIFKLTIPRRVQPGYVQNYFVKYKMPRRIIFRYSKQADMMLRYDKKTDKIVFDNLSPSDNLYKDQFQYYGPDFSNDAFFFEKKKWIYKPDIKLKNSKKKRRRRH